MMIVKVVLAIFIVKLIILLVKMFNLLFWNIVAIFQIKNKDNVQALNDEFRDELFEMLKVETLNILLLVIITFIGSTVLILCIKILSKNII